MNTENQRALLHTLDVVADLALVRACLSNNEVEMSDEEKGAADRLCEVADSGGPLAAEALALVDDERWEDKEWTNSLRQAA